LKAKGIVIFLVLMVLFSFIPANLINAEEQEQKWVTSFTSGNDYLKFEYYEKVLYVRGMMDVTYAMLQFFKPEAYQKYKETMEDMTLSQLTKILDKYLADHPEILHFSVANSFLYALSEIVYKK